MHHITAKSLKDQVTSSQQTFQKTRCSWCQTEANYWTSLSEENFVPIPDKTLAGEPAFAIFCPECLKDENRKNEIKFAVTIGDAEDAVPAQVPYRDLQDKDSPNSTGSLKGEDVEGLGQRSGGVVNDKGEVVQEVEPITPGPKIPEDTGVPAEEATGSGTVETRATENVSTGEKKGVLGKLLGKDKDDTK